MNALAQLINQSLKHHNIKKVKLVKQLGYSNLVKGMRRLDELNNTLNDPLKLLPQIAKLLKIEPHLMYAAFSDALIEKTEKEKKQFKANMSISYKTRLGFMGALGRHSYGRYELEPLKFDGNESIIEEFDKVLKRFNSYKKKFSDTNGFSYQRTYGESYRFDNDCKLLKINKLEHSYQW